MNPTLSSIIAKPSLVQVEEHDLLLLYAAKTDQKSSSSFFSVIE